MALRLSVIDQTPVHGDRPRLAAPQASVELAVACEAFGYHRYWLAEHHDSIQFAGPAPEILLARIASATERMRIGSGGVMLPHYSPFKVAETFALLGSLFPGRIDLGIGRAPGGSQLSSMALAAPGLLDQHDHYPRQASELCGFLRGDLPASHPFAHLHCAVDDSTRPELWMLGSSGGSAGFAGQLGMGLALARFIDPQGCDPAIFHNHAQQFEAAGHGSRPPRLLALAVICAASDEQARDIAGSAALRKVLSGQRPQLPLLSPGEVAERYRGMSAAQREAFDSTLGNMVVGSPATCRQQIIDLAERFGCEEIGIVTVTHGLAERLESYRLLARALL
ncbi:MsnO8 family LLM class oxidoreductase [Pseudomonas sp. LRF_L74]|uniref:MsnO8 family LLM class oxidoreductase n=1 Tax=Pseudomonas sp. LRF_L74 TaxID=3369422 RepID=UPI003F603000